jgi:bifunctional UDP-N-acetylglucosamine pyrophosphorylase/glucosamine-1-phosphate N-acetyltransferase
MSDRRDALKVVIAAAGAGRRAGLPYPKTLHPVEGVPILVRILRLVQPFDAEPSVVVSSAGREPIARSLAEHGLAATLVVQPEPSGMGDAVQCYLRSPAASDAEQVLLLWGDLPYLRAGTLATLVAEHARRGAVMSFPTCEVADPYTVVRRDAQGRVLALEETREGGMPPPRGERDIGVFLFRASAVGTLLAEPLPDRFGARTGEHGFLYLVKHLAARGERVAALPIAHPDELVSLNALTDLDRGSSP